MKQIIEETVKTTKLVPGGQAMAELADGRKVFIWGALPQETVRIQLTKLKPSYAEGFVTKVLEPNSERIAPRDECYLATSPWQIMTEAAELAYKSQLVVDTFRQEHIELPLVSIQTDGKFWQYRNKMEYSLWYDHDTARIWPAFHRRGSHQKILVKTSSIERSEIWAEAQRVIETLNSDPAAEARHYQSLLVRCNQAGEVSSALFKNGEQHPKMRPLSDSLLGQTYHYSPNGFFQINLPVYELALNGIKRHLGDGKVVDMYSGVGTIGLSVAGERPLTLVETDNSAYAELEHNLAGRPNVRGVHAKSEDALEYIVADATIIVDPPRAGLDVKVVDRILEVLPPRVIYLSCNPATQARDVARLSERYRIESHTPFNFFPRTPHIENVVSMSRA